MILCTAEIEIHVTAINTQSTHLIRHNHQPTISQRAHILVLLVMLQTEDLLDSLDFIVLHDLIVFRLAHVEQFSTQREYTPVIASDYTETSDSKGLGGVSLRQNQCTIFRIFGPSVVSVRKLREASYSGFDILVRRTCRYQ